MHCVERHPQPTAEGKRINPPTSLPSHSQALQLRRGSGKSSPAASWSSAFSTVDSSLRACSSPSFASSRPLPPPPPPQAAALRLLLAPLLRLLKTRSLLGAAWGRAAAAAGSEPSWTTVFRERVSREVTEPMAEWELRSEPSEAGASSVPAPRPRLFPHLREKQLSRLPRAAASGEHRAFASARQQHPTLGCHPGAGRARRTAPLVPCLPACSLDVTTGSSSSSSYFSLSGPKLFSLDCLVCDVSNSAALRAHVVL